MRVFCVGTVHDDLLMWGHYADCHRGVVIQLRCLPEHDTALCGARPIAYSSAIPVIARTVDEWVSHTFGDARIDFDCLFTDLAFTKSEHWRYEQEWRCWTAVRDADERLGEPFTLDPKEIAAVYLGCRMPAEERNALIQLVRERLDHVALFQARQSTSDFCLEFDPL